MPKQELSVCAGKQPRGWSWESLSNCPPKQQGYISVHSMGSEDHGVPVFISARGHRSGFQAPSDPRVAPREAVSRELRPVFWADHARHPDQT